ncbi:MAG TPA: hypothetical protein VMD53_05330 [Rhizomicrobium sp.]|nr:hypothetical protein [Rhizomicrobium sp.]
MRVLALAALGIVAASAASAQSMPACSGTFEIIRTDTINPGKLDEFKEAVRDNQAWYTAHGMKDRVLLGQVLNMEGPNGSAAYATDSAMTIHADIDPDAADVPHDAAYSAFVAKYKDSSTIKSTTMVCVSDISK